MVTHSNAWLPVVFSRTAHPNLDIFVSSVPDKHLTLALFQDIQTEYAEYQQRKRREKIIPPFFLFFFFFPVRIAITSDKR